MGNIWIGMALLVVSMLLYLATMGYILPRILLRAEYLPVTLSARGARRCRVNGKRCIVYERDLGHRRYISHYLLCESEGCKLLKCMVTSAVRQMEYDVILFNRYDKIFDVVHVKESLASSFTKLLSLPEETSYVAIRLRRVNKRVISASRVAEMEGRGVGLYAILSFLFTFIEALIVMAGVAYAFGEVFRENLVNRFDARLALVTLVATLVSLLITWIAASRAGKGKRKQIDEGLEK